MLQKKKRIVIFFLKSNEIKFTVKKGQLYKHNNNNNNNNKYSAHALNGITYYIRLLSKLLGNYCLGVAQIKLNVVFLIKKKKIFSASIYYTRAFHCISFSVIFVTFTIYIILFTLHQGQKKVIYVFSQFLDLCA